MIATNGSTRGAAITHHLARIWQVMRRFKNFDVQHTQCASQADRGQLLSVVQSGFGDFLVFNRLMQVQSMISYEW